MVGSRDRGQGGSWTDCYRAAQEKFFQLLLYTCLTDALPLKLKLEGELSAQIYYQFMSINEELGRHRGKSDRQSVLYVVLSVRVRSMCCGNVLITKIVGIYL